MNLSGIIRREGDDYAEGAPDAADAGVRPTRDRRYVDMSDVVRSALRRVMEARGAAAFYRLKAELEAAVDEFERSGGAPFDPREFEPRAFE